MGSGKSQQLVTAILFCTALAALFALHATDVFDAAKSAYSTGRTKGLTAMASQFDSVHNARYADDREWVNLYGLANRALGKREVADYQVVRDSGDSLYAQEVSWFAEASGESDPSDVAACAAALRDATERAGGRFLFVQCPYKTADGIAELADYVRPGRNERFDEIVQLLSASGTACLDLREVEACQDWYRTDHHWTCDAAFAATGKVIAWLSELPGLEVLGECLPLLDGNVYKRVERNNCFLGSAGVKVGEWYVGKDDFSYLAPSFETDLEYWHYKIGTEDAHFEGGFEEAFIDSALLDDPDYYNKHQAYLHGGYVENVIMNHSAPNDLKCLFVAHSYGRPMTQYLSLAFAETRYLDPQEGRYNDSYIAYVEDYQPDVVIIMYDDVFNVG